MWLVDWFAAEVREPQIEMMAMTKAILAFVATRPNDRDTALFIFCKPFRSWQAFSHICESYRSWEKSFCNSEKPDSGYLKVTRGSGAPRMTNDKPVRIRDVPLRGRGTNDKGMTKYPKAVRPKKLI